MQIPELKLISPAAIIPLNLDDDKEDDTQHFSIQNKSDDSNEIEMLVVQDEKEKTWLNLLAMKCTILMTKMSLIAVSRSVHYYEIFE